MRRAAFAVVFALLAAARPAPGQTVVVGVGGELTGEAGGQIRVPVFADLRGAPGQRLGSYTLRLQWDPAVLAWVSNAGGVFGQVTENADSAYYGVLRVGGLSAAGVDGLFDLFAGNFGILADASTALTLTVLDVAAAGSLADLTPITTARSGTYCPALGRWGDLDRDGQANSRDALAILSAIVGLPLDTTFTLGLGDVDGDAQVNSRDALITLSYAVGLEVPGQRVLLYAPGAACGTGGTTGIAILPDTIDLAVGQEIRPILMGSAGGGSAGTSVNWAVANPDIATVSGDGKLAGRGAGTTRLTAALGPGITASVPVIVRARRGVWHVDATRASLMAIQMGTGRYPFSTPQQAFPVVADGDTVRVWPGVHDYLGYQFCTLVGGGGGGGPPQGPIEQCTWNGYLDRDLVILGDTLPDGTRPVLRGHPDADQAVYLDGARRFVMRNLELRGFGGAAVYQSQPVSLAEFENLHIDLGDGNDGILLYYGADTVIVRNVEFAGNGIGGSSPLEIDDGSSVVVIDRVRVDGTNGGLYLYEADSVDIRDSWFRTGYESVYLSNSLSGARVYAAGNYFESRTDYGFAAYDVHALHSEHNVFRLGDYGYAGLTVYGVEYPPRAGSSFVSRGDSIVTSDSVIDSYQYAFDIEDLDSIALDSMRMVIPDSGFIVYPGYLFGNRVAVRNSRFTGVSGNPLYLGGELITVDNTELVGCPAPCALSAGLSAESWVDSVGLIRVTGNTFRRTGITLRTWNSDAVRRLEFSGNTVDSATYGVLSYADSVVLADNVMSGIQYYGLEAYPRYLRPATAVEMRRNRITVVGTGYYPLDVQQAHLTSSGNRYQSPYYGVYVYNYTGSNWQLSMTGDTVVTDPTAYSGRGIYLYGGFTGSVRKSRIEGGGHGLDADLTGGTLALDSNVITGTVGYGVDLFTVAGTSITGRWNNISGNAGGGLLATGAGTVGFTLGRFVGNGSWAVDATYGSVDASQNWWGSVDGPPGSGPNAVTGSVNTANFLTSDPADVPPLGPPAAPFVADLWRAPIGGLATAGTAPAPPATRPELRDDRAERAAERQERRGRAEARAMELQAAREQRKAEPQAPR